MSLGEPRRDSIGPSGLHILIRRICPICDARKLVEPTGPVDSPILVFGWAPGKKEIAKGIPWIGPAGMVLESELLRHGIQRNSYRLTNLWLHEPAEIGTKRNLNPLYQKELDWHFSELKNEFVGKRAILIMGAEPTHILGISNISSVTGTSVKSQFIPSSVDVVMAMVNPAQALHDLLGEVRLALDNFALALHERGI